MKNASKAVSSIQAKALIAVAELGKKERARANAKPAMKEASKPVSGKPSAKAAKQPVSASASEPAAKALSGETVGIDVGDRVSQFCRLNLAGEIAEQGRLHTNAASMEKQFGKLPAAVIALEAGTQSGWIARLLRHFGHQVIVANPRDLAAVTSSKKKSDRNDAEKLARLARADLKLLNPTYVRSLESARDAIPLRARDGFVRARTQLVNVARSLAKIEGRRLPATITKTFGERALSELPAALAGSMELLLRMIDFLSMAIEEAAEDIEFLLKTKYPEARKLMQISGVGSITALSYVLTLGAPERFRDSRDVGAFLGMTPKRKQSGERDPQLGITKAGDSTLRRLLVQCAHHIMGHYGKDSALRQWGQKLAARGGPNANKRAIVAVARKLSVILHKLWRTGEDYVPFPA